MKFLFLYTELAEYVLACCNQLATQGEVHIVRWPVNKEAPFEFSFNQNLKIYNKNDYNFQELQKLVNHIKPDVIICSGWIDKDYLKITKSYFKKIPTIMTCDTQWRGDFKQRLASIISRFTLMRIFSHAWVPGEIQKKYVMHLGFKPNNIAKGFYSCDLEHFNHLYLNQKNDKETNFPKRFLYVGRYYDFKGVNELWQAFAELQNEMPNEWELWCLGTGDIVPFQHHDIKHYGFVQPKLLENYTAQTGVFILPSRYEPWGVVVHEYAACGFPLLLSNKIGAKEQFLKSGENGFEFEPNNKEAIKTALKKIISLPQSELIKMSQTSHQLAQSVSPAIWMENLLKLIKQH
jgi:glycosyltransferase involved in cell wall biosynthesis